MGRGRRTVLASNLRPFLLPLLQAGARLSSDLLALLFRETAQTACCGFVLDLKALERKKRKNWCS